MSALMPMSQLRWKRRAKELRSRAQISWDLTGPTIQFSPAARKIIDDALIDLQSRRVFYDEYEFEVPKFVNDSLGQTRALCVSVRQQLAGDAPPLSSHFHTIEQACGRFQTHLALNADLSAMSPIPDTTIAGLRELRLVVAEAIFELWTETKLPSAQALYNMIEYYREPTTPWLQNGT